MDYFDTVLSLRASSHIANFMIANSYSCLNKLVFLLVCAQSYAPFPLAQFLKLLRSTADCTITVNVICETLI